MLHHFLYDAFRNVARSIQELTQYLKKLTKEITYKFRETEKKIAQMELELKQLTEQATDEIRYLREELEYMSRDAMMFSDDAREDTYALSNDVFIHYGIYSIDKETRKGYIGFNVNQFPTIEDNKLYVVPVQSGDNLARAGTQEWKLPEGNNTAQIISPDAFDVNNLPNGTIVLDGNTVLSHRELSRTNHAFYQEVVTFKEEEGEIIYDKNTPFFIDIFYTGRDEEGNLVVNRSDRQDLKYYQL